MEAGPGSNVPTTLPLWESISGRMSHRLQSSHKAYPEPFPPQNSAYSISGTHGLLLVQIHLFVHFIGGIKFICVPFLFHSAPPLTEKEVEVSNSSAL